MVLCNFHSTCNIFDGRRGAAHRQRGVQGKLRIDMRVYMHFEEEDPNYTAALTAAGPETTLADLLQNFLRSYVEHYGEGAADLEAGSLELRSSKSANQPHALFASSPCDAPSLPHCLRLFPVTRAPVFCAGKRS